MLPRHRSHQTLPARFIPHIMLDERRILAQIIGGGLAGLRIEFSDDELGAFFHQPGGGGPADAGATPRYNGDLALYAAHTDRLPKLPLYRHRPPTRCR